MREETEFQPSTGLAHRQERIPAVEQVSIRFQWRRQGNHRDERPTRPTSPPLAYRPSALRGCGPDRLPPSLLFGYQTTSFVRDFSLLTKSRLRWRIHHPRSLPRCTLVRRGLQDRWSSQFVGTA